MGAWAGGFYLFWESIWLAFDVIILFLNGNVNGNKATLYIAVAIYKPFIAAMVIWLGD